MSRKKKSKPTSSASIARAGPDAAGSTGLAEAALGAARYKEAIEQFKELLKRERRSTWVDGLAAAYAGRAKQLADKGMVKEALALWRTRSEACDVPLLDGPYVDWLMQTGQFELALGLLPSVEKLPAEARDRTRAQLALAVLVAPDHLLTGLSEESLSQRAAARAAIAAAVHGDSAVLETALQAISFRSPYRDLRPLLKALALQATDLQSAAETLARVPENGPFRALAQALRVCLMPGAGWLAGLHQLDQAGRTLVLDLKGCPQTQRALVFDLIGRSGETAPTPLELFDLILRHRRVIPDGLARRVGLRLLPHVPQRLDSFRASFPSPSAAEQEQVLALAAELKQRPDQAEQHWLRLIKLLGNMPSGQRRAALVLRRIADEHVHHSPNGTLCVHARDWLAQSVRLDPTDRDTHLRLLRDARLHGELKNARTWLDAARQQFPDDALVLQEAVEIALASGAFKKASGLAKQALQVDPINTRVRGLIGQAHLAHARKLIGARSLQAARRELDEAEEWLRSPGERGLLELLRGFAAEPAAAGDAALRQAVADLGGPLVGAFHLLLEGRRLKILPKLAPQDLLRRAGIDMTTTPGTSEVVALAQVLHAAPDRDSALPAALGVLSGMLGRAAATLRFSESDHLLVCEALHRNRQTDLTRRFAAAALERWPGRPVFVYLEAAARFGTEPWRMSQREWQRLDRAYEEARDQGDERTATRLSKLLGAAGPDDDDMPPGLDDLDVGGIHDVMDMILESGGVEAFLAMARQQLGKATFDQARRDFKGSNKKFAQFLVKLLTASAESEPTPPPHVALPVPRQPGRQSETTPPPHIVLLKPRQPGSSKPSPANTNQTNLFDE